MILADIERYGWTDAPRRADTGPERAFPPGPLPSELRVPRPELGSRYLRPQTAAEHAEEAADLARMREAEREDADADAARFARQVRRNPAVALSIGFEGMRRPMFGGV